MIKKLITFILVFFITFNIVVPIIPKASENRNYLIQMKQDLLTLMLAYPDYINEVEKKDDKVYCIMNSGKKIIYDDKIEKTEDQKLAAPDLQDILEQYYPLDKKNEIMNKSFNPGRVRNYDLLNDVYGSSKNSIERNLINLKCAYPNYQFNSKNKAIDCLNSALKELINLSKNNPDIANILYPASGTYNYRLISGTGRLSPHSYGIAIDLKSDKRDYWKWSSEKQGKERLADYPKELVETFENNNFVWGGKWGHFDILHFEYRPEIILKAKYFTNWDNDKDWFDGVPLEDENTKKYIDIIEKALR